MHPFIHLTKMQRAWTPRSALCRVPGRKDREDTVVFCSHKKRSFLAVLAHRDLFSSQGSVTTHNRRQRYHPETPHTGQAWQPRLQEIERREGLAVPEKVKVTQECTVSQRCAGACQVDWQKGCCVPGHRSMKAHGCVFQLGNTVNGVKMYLSLAPLAPTNAGDIYGPRCLLLSYGQE